MSYELLYTSAARGLKPGSQGFCVVVSTQGLVANLAERLEALSGYRHVFGQQDPQAALNPIVYSHLRLTVGGRAYHVLSRVAPAGLDYTQRSNKLAHHVALENAELIAAGPAALAAAPGFLATDWDGQPRLLAQGRRPPALATTPAACRAWQAATGDAGWGGALAETAVESAGRPAIVVFPPGTDVLSLMAEALALVPVERRWQVTFSTYYTRLPAGVDCQWRAVVAGSPEAGAARQVQGALVIDLSRTLAAARGGALVEAARTGKLPAAGGARDSARAAASRAAGGIELLPELEERIAPTPPRRAPLDSMSRAGIDLDPMPPSVELNWPLSDDLARGRFSKPKPKLEPKPRWPLWAGVSVTLLAIAGLTLAAWQHGTPTRIADSRAADTHARPNAPLEPHGNDRPSNPSITTGPPPIDSGEAQDGSNGRQPETAADDAQSPDLLPFDGVPDQPPDNPPVDDDTSPAVTRPADATPDTGPGEAIIPAAAPDDTAQSEGGALLPAAVDLPDPGGVESKRLFRLPTSASQYSFALHGPPMTDGARLALKPDGETYWVEAEFKSALSGSERIARFQRKDGELTFRWEPLKSSGQRMRWRELKNQTLHVRSENGLQQIIALREPRHAAPLRLDLSGKSFESTFEIDAPPPGDYQQLLLIPANLSASVGDGVSSINFRQNPVPLPVEISLTLVPVKIGAKSQLQSRQRFSVRLTYQGAHIDPEHLRVDDLQAFAPTGTPNVITPEMLDRYRAELEERIRLDSDKLKTQPAPPELADPERRKQLAAKLHEVQERLKAGLALTRLLSALQAAEFGFDVYCDSTGERLRVASSAVAAPSATSIDDR